MFFVGAKSKSSTTEYPIAPTGTCLKRNFAVCCPRSAEYLDFKKIEGLSFLLLLILLYCSADHLHFWPYFCCVFPFKKSSVIPPTLLKARGEFDSLRQAAGWHLWDKHAGQKNRDRGGVRSRGEGSGGTGVCGRGYTDARGAEGW